MNSRDTLIDLDGWATVRSPHTCSDRPEEIVNYWPTGMRSKELIEHYGIPVPAELEYSTMGRYAVKTGRPMYGLPRYIALTEGGNTKSIKVEVNPIPCPKVRKGIETRWRFGHWEKYLKAEGWVAA